MKKKKIEDTITEESNELIEENVQELNQQEENINVDENINPEEILINKVPEKPKKTAKEQKEFNAKLFINYIGKNYEKIMKEKFSFPAFFFNGLYLIYRKMYISGIALYFLLIFLISIFMDSMVISIVITVIYVIISILLGIFTNKKYCEKAYEECIEINEKYDYISDEAIIKLCKRKGGTNFAAIIATIILASGVAVPSAFVIRTLTGIEFKKAETDIKEPIANSEIQTASNTDEEEYFLIPYNTEIQIDNEFSIKLPTGSIDESDNVYEKNFKIIPDNTNPNNTCEFNFSQIDGYTDPNKFLTEYAEFKKVSAPITKKVNGMTWYTINFDSVMDNVTYSAITKDNKVYLLDYEVDLDIDKTICDKYYNEVINSIKTK